jgi:hypothetical protein
MVLPTSRAQALRGEPITVFGSGQQSRCFAHVGDVVEALVRLLAAPAAVGEVFNVGDVAKLERVIGFRPCTPLDRIVADVVADQRRRLPQQLRP